jgi:uncharacterized membrane protein
MRKFIRVLLGLALVFAGTSHLTFARKDFQAQVPDFVPLKKDTTIVASGVAEIGVGTMLTFAGKRKRGIGVLAAIFFTAIFPGNLAQFAEQRSAFGLDTDGKRFGRLFFQPVLIAAALWSTRR